MSVAVVRDDTCACMAGCASCMAERCSASCLPLCVGSTVHSHRPSQPGSQDSIQSAGWHGMAGMAGSGSASSGICGRQEPAERGRQPGAGGRSLRQGVCRGPCPCDLTRLGCGCRRNWRPVKRANLRAHPASTVSCWLCLAASADGGCPTCGGCT
jgi:hypothetical protein